MLEVDGSQGEGGGQLLRTSLSLSALTGRPFRLTNLRAGRSRPGLRPQHLTAVRAVAALCQAQLTGDALGSQTLEFKPRVPPQAGRYEFDVEDVAGSGSAGSVTLIFEALLWPLLFAGSPSHIQLRGGTHVPHSPPFHYLAEVLRPLLARLGIVFSLSLEQWGWYPAGGGAMSAIVEPATRLKPLPALAGERDRVAGMAAVTNLPSHIPQRMARRAENLLARRGLRARVEPLRLRGRGPGAGLFLWLVNAGFSSLGRQGVPAEKVAEAAVAELLAFLDNNVDIDRFLADQLLLPLALAPGTSSFNTERLTLHTVSNARLLKQWLDVPILIEGDLNKPGRVTVTGKLLESV